MTSIVIETVDHEDIKDSSLVTTVNLYRDAIEIKGNVTRFAPASVQDALELVRWLRTWASNQPN